MPGTLIFMPMITRDFVRKHPHAIFVFGDNTHRTGSRGQAGEMRGEPNAIGVATKFAPGRAPGDYFEDDHWASRKALNDDIDLVQAAFNAGKTIYVPRDGLGTGLSELPQRAPGLYGLLVERFKAMSKECPWEAPARPAGQPPAAA